MIQAWCQATSAILRVLSVTEHPQMGCCQSVSTEMPSITQKRPDLGKQNLQLCPVLLDVANSTEDSLQ